MGLSRDLLAFGACFKPKQKNITRNPEKRFSKFRGPNKKNAYTKLLLQFPPLELLGKKG
jgi:hypothetical protein